MPTKAQWGELTTREEVLRCLAWGWRSKEIAAKLGISVKTVYYHRDRTSEKLDLHTRTDIVRYAITRGWMQEGEEPK
jgi:two-component system response regulator NreC